MRSLHRDVGFLVVGLTAVYALSGLALINRDAGFLKREVHVEKQLSPNLEPSELGKALHMKDVKPITADGETIHFKNGTYDKTTGIALFTIQDFVFPVNKLVNLHKASGKGHFQWLYALYALLLLFLALSSFWMYKPGTRLFWRGICLAGAGVLAAAVLALV